MKKILVEIWYRLCKYVFVIIPTASFYQIVSFVNYTRLGFKWRPLNLKNPKSFNEKLNYIKLHDRNPLAPLVADKILARDWVKEQVGEKYLVPLIGIFKSAKDINFNQLPDQFALKTNHGSGWNLICQDKQNLDWPKEVKKVDKWLGKNAYYLSREWHYNKIVPGLLCEELLGYGINDYKFFCFNGKPLYIQVDNDRFANHKRSLYTTNWEETNYQIRYTKIEEQLAPPKCLAEMVEVAKKLSSPFRFCRVDLYESNGQVYFGELTLHPGGGAEPFLNKQQELEMGQLIKLDGEE